MPRSRLKPKTCKTETDTCASARGGESARNLTDEKVLKNTEPFQSHKFPFQGCARRTLMEWL